MLNLVSQLNVAGGLWSWTRNRRSPAPLTQWQLVESYIDARVDDRTVRKVPREVRGGFSYEKGSVVEVEP